MNLKVIKYLIFTLNISLLNLINTKPLIYWANYTHKPIIISCYLKNNTRHIIKLKPHERQHICFKSSINNTNSKISRITIKNKNYNFVVNQSEINKLNDIISKHDKLDFLCFKKKNSPRAFYIYPEQLI